MTFAFAARVLGSVLAIALATAASVAAHAAERAGVTMPDRVEAAGKHLVLNGLGVREATILNIDVYVAGLYLEHRSSDARAILRSDQVKRLRLRFVRDVDREDIVEAWTEGFRKNAGDALPRLRKRIAQLNAWMSSIEEGHDLTFSLVPGKGVEVRKDTSVKGTIPGDDFARVFLSIWLGPAPPNDGLKDGLLGR